MAVRSEVYKTTEPWVLLLPASPSVARAAEGTAYPCLIRLGREGSSSPPLQLQGQRRHGPAAFAF